MITRETLELAAKAAGYSIFVDNSDALCLLNGRPGHLRRWNPEHDDGDSARLRTDLEIDTVFWPSLIIVRHEQSMLKVSRADHENKHAALRYATLMVAAEIGRRMG